MLLYYQPYTKTTVLLYVEILYLFGAHSNNTSIDSHVYRVLSHEFGVVRLDRTLFD